MPSEKTAANGDPSSPQDVEGSGSGSKATKGSRQEPPAQDFVRLLDYLKANRGFDFSGYKLSSLIRRVQKRMQEVGVASFNDYIDYLEVHPDEFLPLFNTVLINVTGFFRDPQAWQALAAQVLPRILESKGNDEPIRCWSAGCASGQEAYTLAILLAEALGEPELRRRVKLYATDVDEDALVQARQGSYTEAEVEGLPAELLSRYFEKTGERWVFRSDLRRSLIFGRHDLVQDAAISRLDLLVCRNTLMYLNAETQAKVLARFHFALQRGGYLFLGKAETLLSHSNTFRPVDLKTRIFQRASSSSQRDRILAIAPAIGTTDPKERNRQERLREAAFDSGPVAVITVDAQGHLALANERARRLFNLGPNDIGRLLQDLEVSYRLAELRSSIEAARDSRLPVILKDVGWHPPGSDPRVLEIQIVPLTDGPAALLGVTIFFLDLTLQHNLRSDLERANQDLEAAYEELQSANEELETMNEELQSTNDEQRTINDQLQDRSEELDRVNVYLRSLLGSLRSAVVVLDQDLRVEIWSDKAQELWGLRGNEVQGKVFFELDIGLPVDQLRQPLLDCLDSGPRGTEMLLDSINRRGRPFRCRVNCTRVGGDGTGPAGVILLMEEVPQAAGAGSDH